MSNPKIWTNVIVDGVKSVVSGSVTNRRAFNESSLDLDSGLDVEELNTIPSELLDFFK